MCSCEVNILSSQTTLSCSVDSSAISFNSQTLPLNVSYSYSHELPPPPKLIKSNLLLLRHNCFKLNYSVDTFDADNSTVTGGSNELKISVSYIENTSVRGVLVVLLHIIDGGGVDLSHSVYRVVERVQLRSNDEFGNITNGTYKVLTYDIESNGILELGKTSPATSERIDIDGVGMS